MKNRVFIGLLCFCALLVGTLLRSALPTASAQSTTSVLPAQAERYSIAADSNYVYFADTQTGRLWYYNTVSVVNEKGIPQKHAWRDMPSPVAAASQKP